MQPVGRRRLLAEETPMTGSSHPSLAAILALLLCLFAPPSTAGGSHYGTPAGSLSAFSGEVSEWPVPTPKFARDPAVAPDGSIFIAVMRGNKVARFDPASNTFREWNLPPDHHPHGLLVDRRGIVWTTGNGNGTIGRLDPANGDIREYRTSSDGGGPHTIVISDDGSTLWFTLQSGNRIGRLATATGQIREYQTAGGPYGITLDRQGLVWFCRMGDDKLGILDPASGTLSELAMPAGSRPRRMATAPDGSLWVTLYGSNKLAQVDPAGRRILRQIALPAGKSGGAYAVSIDGAGIVWANEIKHDSVVRLDPASGDLRVVKLPGDDTGIRKMVVDARGRLWYMGSHNGRLGMVR
jgi:virginiamycin B lyase